MPWIPLAISAASAVKGYMDQKKAASAAKDAAAASQVDINALDAKTREIAQKNALQSAELERQLTPEVPQLRTAANRSLLGALGAPDTVSPILRDQMGNQVAAAQSPLLAAAIAKAKANLDLGGQLPLDVRNLVARKAAATAGTVSPGGLGLGRDINARDLGLTSLDIQRQRLADAASLGQQEFGVNQAGVDTGFRNQGNLLNILQMLQGINDSRFGRSLATAQYGQSIQQPVVGLDPGSVADAMTGNANARSAALSNQANIYGQSSQNFMNLAGMAGAYGAMNYKPATYQQPIYQAH